MDAAPAGAAQGGGCKKAGHHMSDATPIYLDRDPDVRHHGCESLAVSVEGGARDHEGRIGDPTQLHVLPGDSVVVVSGRVPHTATGLAYTRSQHRAQDRVL